MPKIYSEEERNDIITRLKDEANLLMQEKGVRKTGVWIYYLMKKFQRKIV